MDLADSIPHKATSNNTKQRLLSADIGDVGADASRSDSSSDRRSQNSYIACNWTVVAYL
jgi:hypothetical protein